MRWGLFGIAAVGCGTPCDRLCEARAAHFDPCLAAWQYDWGEFLAMDAKDYEGECKRAMGVEWAAASNAEQALLGQTCEAFVDEHEAAAGDCDRQWALFEEELVSLP